MSPTTSSQSQNNYNQTTTAITGQMCSSTLVIFVHLFDQFIQVIVLGIDGCQHLANIFIPYINFIINRAHTLKIHTVACFIKVKYSMYEYLHSIYSFLNCKYSHVSYYKMVAINVFAYIGKHECWEKIKKFCSSIILPKRFG